MRFSLAALLLGPAAAYQTSVHPGALDEGPLAQAVKDEAAKRREAADEVLGEFIRTSLPQEVDVDRVLNRKFRTTGIPVVRGWRPRLERSSPPTKAKASIAQLTEQQQAPAAKVTYVHPTMTSSFVRFGRHAQLPTLSFHRVYSSIKASNASRTYVRPRVTQDGYSGEAQELQQQAIDAPEYADPDRLQELKRMREQSETVRSDWEKNEAEVKDAADKGRSEWLESEEKVRKTAEDEWNANSKEDAEARAEEWIRDRASKEAAREQAEAEAKARGEYDWKQLKSEQKALDASKKTGIARCGFSWDDAAAKMGAWCSSDGATNCMAPPGTTDNPKSYWYQEEYRCYNDLPDIGVRAGGRRCRATTKASTHSWCTEYCNTPGSYCDPVYCDCSDGGTGLEDTEAFKVPETFNVSAPIQPHDPNISACTPHEARTISACSGLGI